MQFKEKRYGVGNYFDKYCAPYLYDCQIFLSCFRWHVALLIHVKPVWKSDWSCAKCIEYKFLSFFTFYYCSHIPHFMHLKFYTAKEYNIIQIYFKLIFRFSSEYYNLIQKINSLKVLVWKWLSWCKFSKWSIRSRKQRYFRKDFQQFASCHQNQNG